MKRLIVATRNKKKLLELRRYLKGVKVELVSLEYVNGAPGIVEDGRTFKDNADKKALTISMFSNGLVLADDSGLAVDALKGKPGVKSSRFAGDDADDRKNNAKLLKKLKGIPSGRRKARFICHVSIADNGRVINNIEEDCRGVISFDLRGRYGFGYDPLFIIPKYKKTFGELGLKVKDKMSHRSKALKKAVTFLKRYL
ncbi:RdgB/HAM1 family non-canonical purine NTP pyrophosphatase [Candidatus Omnitrophota bacterium]